MSVGTAISVGMAGCLGGETSDDSPESSTEDDSDESVDESESSDDGDSEDAGGNELQVVVRGNDESIEGAAVTVDGETDETAENGGVLFDGLEADEYTVAVEADGFESTEVDVDVGERDLTIQSIELAVE